MEATQMKPGLKVRSTKHPDDLGEILRPLFGGRGAIVRWNGEPEEHPALASLLEPEIEQGHTHSVSIQAAVETQEGVFEDLILGTYPDARAALRAAKDYAKANHGETAQVMSALPTDPAFASWDALKALVYFDDDPMEMLGLVVERF